MLIVAPADYPSSSFGKITLWLTLIFFFTMIDIFDTTIILSPCSQDLVKSHLMFAVREEVEVLKEKIAELMERITQLETENTILKANATQDTLAQLQHPGNS